MNYSELIHNYIEGELEPSKEEQLFLALSGDDELRKEFKTQLKIDRAFSQRLSSFVPSGMATSNLFAKLGISSQIPIAVGTNSINRFFHPLNKIIVTGLISVTLTAVIFLIAFKDKIFNETEISNKPLAYESTMQQSSTNNINEIDKTQISGIAPNSASNYGVQKELKSGPKIPIIYKSSTQQITINEEQIPESNQYIEKDNEVNLATLTDVDFPKYSFFKNNASEKLMPQLLQNFTLPKRRALNGFRLELSSNQYWQIPKPQISESWIPAFHNNGIALSYKIDDNIRIGGEFRNEHFYQNFSGMDDFGNKFSYTQFPNYQTLALFASYKFLKTDILDGFMQISAGGTATGRIGRIAIGTEFEPSTNFTFTLKFETSVLHYIHQNNHFLSPKIGLSYGIGLNL